MFLVVVYCCMVDNSILILELFLDVDLGAYGARDFTYRGNISNSLRKDYHRRERGDEKINNGRENKRGRRVRGW